MPHFSLYGHLTDVIIEGRQNFLKPWRIAWFLKRLSTTNPPMYSPHLQQDTPLPHTFREGHQPRRYFQAGHFLISWFLQEISNGSLATKAPN